MAIYIPHMFEPSLPPTSTFPPTQTLALTNHVSENGDATVAPCVRKRPINPPDEIPRDLYTSDNGLLSLLGDVTPSTKRRKNSLIPTARYGSVCSNIFLRMQNTDIPREEEDPYLYMPKPLPPPDDFLIDINDQRYLQLFLERGRVMIRPLGFFFPTACDRMFKTSLEYKRLRHAIIAIAMHYNERTSTRHCPNPRLNRYLEIFSPGCTTLAQPSVLVQEGEIFALFLVLTVTLVQLSETKDVATLRRYVKRLYKLFRTAQAEVQNGQREKLSPLLFSIWRQVMRINVTFALGVAHFPSIFPPPAFHAGGRPAEGLGPVRQYLGDASREFESWTLSQLELDDLGNRIFRLHLRASAIRGAKTRYELGEEELKLNTQTLLRENERWKQKPVIQVAEYMELLHRQQSAPEPPPEKTFLNHSTTRFKNPLYACLLLTHYAMTISLSLIVDPRVGPRTVDRVDAAMQICRIYAALGGNHPVGSLTCLASVWWAGLVFDSRKFPEEAKWVRDQLADPMHRGLGMRYLTHLKAVWKRAQRSWDVWTEFPPEEDGT